jgi:hypothetical protein
MHNFNLLAEVGFSPTNVQAASNCPMAERILPPLVS